MIEARFKNNAANIDCFTPTLIRGDWDFLKIEAGMKGDGGPACLRVEKILSDSDKLAFKVWQLSPFLKALSYLLAISLLVAAGILAFDFRKLPVIPSVTIGQIAYLVMISALTLISTYLLGRAFTDRIRWRETCYRIIAGVFIGFVGCVVARLHLWIFDPLFLRYGSLRKYQESK